MKRKDNSDVEALFYEVLRVYRASLGFGVPKTTEISSNSAAAAAAAIQQQQKQPEKTKLKKTNSLSTAW